MLAVVWWQPRSRRRRHQHHWDGGGGGVTPPVDPDAAAPRSTSDSRMVRITKTRTGLRFLILYTLGGATVCIWHGIWYALDTFLYPHDATRSMLVSTLGGAGLCFLLLAGNALLAPPAIFLFDGPSLLSPPIAVTIVMSYRSVALPARAFAALPPDPYYLVALDYAATYLILPWGVVGFWRGFWYLMDAALWVAPTRQSLLCSIVYSFIIGMVCLLLASDDIVCYFPSAKQFEQHPKVYRYVQNGNYLFGRIRTAVLAIGAVNFWRAVWYLWDTCMGLSSTWSACLAHVIGICGLTCLGCLSCITAPPSTIGVDAVADPGTSGV
jgi:hypothetical protein